MTTSFLVDNGSLRASATLNLRKIAHRLTQETGQVVEPVSLLHSSKVDPAELEGKEAETFGPALRRKLAQGETDFLVLPLFFGPSLAMTDYLPKRISAMREAHGPFNIHVTSCLFDEMEGTDLRLAEIMRQRVEEVILPGEPPPPVLLVDHGSPAPAVTAVRNFIAGQLSVMLKGRVSRLVATSMERREGEEYRFTDPLLESVLGQDGFNRGRVIIAMMFLSPGRHAGVEGDVAQICRRAEETSPGLKTVMTDLVGDHPDLVPILADRLRVGLKKAAGG
jgi:sirohydrochlorin ferrochelatase